MTRRIERALLTAFAIAAGASAYKLGVLAYLSAMQGAHDLGSTFLIGSVCCLICAGIALKKGWGSP